MSAEWQPEDIVKLEINNNLWYAVECDRCNITYLVQDGVDRITPKERMEKKAEIKNKKFETTCPYCEHKNQTPAINRVKINFVNFADGFELNPLTEKGILKMEII